MGYFQDLSTVDLASKWAELTKILQNRIHQNAVNKGFWDSDSDPDGFRFLLLIHAEISEAVEALREGNPPSVKAEGYSLVEEELADVIIRLLDFAGGFDLDVASALAKKIEYNTGRAYKHGKKF